MRHACLASRPLPYILEKALASRVVFCSEVIIAGPDVKSVNETLQ